MPKEGDLVHERDQLTLILSFFPRVDARLSTILAIDPAILATLGAAVPSATEDSPTASTAPPSAVSADMSCKRLSNGERS